MTQEKLKILISVSLLCSEQQRNNCLIYCGQHGWSSNAGISRLGHPKMADAFPGAEFLRVYAKGIRHIWSISLAQVFEWIASIEFD